MSIDGDDVLSESVAPFSGFAPSGRTLCPMCDYSLAGLPVEHTCPECGFEYDAETMLWEQRHTEKFLALLIIIELFAVVMIALGAVFPSLAGTRVWAFSFRHWAAVIFLCLPIAVIVAAIRTWRRKPFIALAKSGLLFRAFVGGTRVIPWSKIAAVDFFPNRRFFRLRIKTRTMWRTLHPMKLQIPESDRARFAELANRRMAEDAGGATCLREGIPSETEDFELGI